MRGSGIVTVCHTFIHSRELFLGIPCTLYRGVSYKIQRTEAHEPGIPMQLFAHTHNYAAIYTNARYKVISTRQLTRTFFYRS